MIKSKNDLWTILEVVAHWSLQRMNAPCGSESGLVFLDWCDSGGGGEEEDGELFCVQFFLGQNGTHNIFWYFSMSATPHS